MNTPGPILSVVLGSCNQLNLLKFTLLALRDQKPDVPHEIIVVDCGSDDGTDQFLVGQASSGAIRAILDPEIKSRTSARNQGAHAAAGQFLMFLDPGMIVGPRWWEALLRTMDKDPRVGAAAGKIILPDGRIDHAGLALLEWWEQPASGEALSAYGSGLTSRSILAGRQADHPGSNRSMRVQALSGEGLMVRANAFFSVGGFSARLGRDHHHAKAEFEGEPAGVDLCLRLGIRGWDCVYRYESVMTRLRNALAGDKVMPEEFPDHRDQDVFNSTWLGRARGDFRIVPEQGAVPADQTMIHNYIEPVISFAGMGSSGSEGRAARSMSSVVVVTGDDFEKTRQCVGALLNHTDPEHEIIFVDCGSTDGTLQYLEETTDNRHHCRLLTNVQNPGFAAAHNQGLAAAGGKHVILLSSRAVVTPRWLETLISTAEMHPRAGLVGPMTNRVNGMQHLAGVDYDETGLRGLNSFAAQVTENNAGRVDKAMRLSGFCLLIKRDLMARIGGLDEKFEMGNYEDNDYCLRGQLAGYESLVARGCFVHQGDDSVFTTEQLHQLEQIRGQWEIFKAKWGIPQSTALGEPMDMASLLAGGFQPQRHFQPLPVVQQSTVITKGKETQAAHA